MTVFVGDAVLVPRGMRCKGVLLLGSGPGSVVASRGIFGVLRRRLPSSRSICGV